MVEMKMEVALALKSLVAAAGFVVVAVELVEPVAEIAVFVEKQKVIVVEEVEEIWATQEVEQNQVVKCHLNQTLHHPGLLAVEVEHLEH